MGASAPPTLATSALGRKLWIRESRFHYKGRNHHGLDHVFLARATDTAPKVALKLTENEKAGLIEWRGGQPPNSVRRPTNSSLPVSPGWFKTSWRAR